MTKFEKLKQHVPDLNLMKHKILILAAIIVSVTSCGQNGNKSEWTDEERGIIACDGDIMRVLTINDKEDSLFLRKQCSDIGTEDILSDTYMMLAEKMIATVTSPDQDGVGIAGPQVGISRRIVAVQRMDKEGEPFEVYPNIRITATRGEKEPGGEGCLSVPDRYGRVMRWQDIDIAYSSPVTGRDTSETISGFTAVIFQHETDHLDGILYIDKLEPAE